MRFLHTRFADAWLIEPELREDHRGSFARTYCERVFAEHGCDLRFVQSSISYNHRCGTLRGMHFQIAPYAESKLVRCTRGEIFDVIVDLRPGSATQGEWQGFSLTAENHRSLLIPKGFAHGFQTLADGSEVLYQMDQYFHPQAARGFHHADPAVGIVWPLAVVVLSEADARLGSFADVVDRESPLPSLP